MTTNSLRDDEGAATDDGDDVIELVVRSVADVTGTDPLDLPPLYEAVDADAVERLCTYADGGDLSIQFEYAGCIVTVCAGEDASVEVESDDAVISADEYVDVTDYL